MGKILALASPALAVGVVCFMLFATGYWYFHYREGGQQKTLYLGKTDDPEVKVNEKLGKE